MNKISRKITLAIVLSAIVISFLITISIEVVVNKIVDDTTRDNLSLLSEKNSVEFNSELLKVETQANSLANLVESSFDLDSFKTTDNYLDQYKLFLEPIIKKMAQENEISHSAYVFFLPELDNKAHDVWFADLDLNGVVERQDQFPLSYYDGDLEWKQWYYQPIMTKKAFWTEPYVGTVDADRDIIYFSYTVPIMLKGKVIAVAGSDYYFNTMKEKLEKFKYKKSGYAALVNKQDKFLIHPTLASGVSLRELNNKQYVFIADKIRNSNEGFIDYRWIDNNEKIMSFNRLRNDWVIIFTLEKRDMFSDLEALKLYRVGVLLLGSIIVLIAASYLAKKLSKPIEVIREDLLAMGEGNFDNLLSMKYEGRSDEIGDLVHSVLIMNKRLKASFDTFKDQSSTLEAEVENRTRELIKTNEYLELSLGQVEEQHSELMLHSERSEQALNRVKDIERKLIETEKRASMAYLVNGMAQDLNTPIGNSLTLITYLNSELLTIQKRHKNKTLTQTEFEEFVKSTLESYQLLISGLNGSAELITQFKRMSGDRYIDIKSAFRINEFINMIFSSMKAYYPDHQITLKLDSKDYFIIADIGAFSQLFSNLIENTIKHAYSEFERGMVQIKIERIDEVSLMITYEDFGKGMPVEVTKAMFIPYYSMNVANYTGGMGLNIVYNLVTKAFKGSITLDENTENGVKYYILLQVAIPDQQ